MLCIVTCWRHGENKHGGLLKARACRSSQVVCSLRRRTRRDRLGRVLLEVEFSTRLTAGEAAVWRGALIVRYVHAASARFSTNCKHFLYTIARYIMFNDPRVCTETGSSNTKLLIIDTEIKTRTFDTIFTNA